MIVRELQILVDLEAADELPAAGLDAIAGAVVAAVRRGSHELVVQLLQAGPGPTGTSVLVKARDVRARTTGGARPPQPRPVIPAEE